VKTKILWLASVFSTGLLLLTLPTAGRAGGILPDTLNYSLTLRSGQAAFDVPMSVAFDGTFYYGASGGNSGGSPLQKYDPLTGDVLSAINNGIDYRGLFSDANGDLYARVYGDHFILKMTAPGVFTSFLTLDNSVVDLDDQAPVVLSGDGSVYASRFGNTLNFWSAVDGSFQSSVILSNYGTVPGETANPTGSTAPKDVTLASFGSYYLTYLDDSDEVFAWDTSGNRVGNLVLENNNGANAFSFSYSNGHIFTNEGGFHGYELAAPPIVIPEPGAVCLLLVGLGAGLARRRRYGI
jgi:hypothetical protein